MQQLLLDKYHYTFKNVQTTFKLKHRFRRDSFNLIYVIICDTYKEEDIGETSEGKTKPKDSALSECIANTFGNLKTKN